MHWFGSLITGAKGTILTEFSPKNVFDAFSKEQGTIVWLLVPWVPDILVALDKGELKLADYNLKSWRLMHIGAQPVPPAIVMHWRDYFPNMSYDNNYGLSESTGPGAVHLGLENEFSEGVVGKVVCMAGFFGVTPDGLETILGQGGSDLTAVFASCLLNDTYQTKTLLYKDVPIQSADPKVVRGQKTEHVK
jgi:acyl-CoA synthetase (AMP-forming)/AMP-acid ligase II